MLCSLYLVAVIMLIRERYGRTQARSIFMSVVIIMRYHCVVDTQMKCTFHLSRHITYQDFVFA